MHDQEFRQIIDFFQLSWPGYRKVSKGVKKRIGRHMQELGCRSVDAYLDRLSVRLEDKARCQQLLTVSISRFFRDRRLWEIMENRIFTPFKTLSRKHFKNSWVIHLTHHASAQVSHPSTGELLHLSTTRIPG